MPNMNLHPFAIMVRSGKPCTAGNNRTDGDNVWLHNNLIIRNFSSVEEEHDLSSFVAIDMCGYETRLTRHRISEIVPQLHCGTEFYYHRKGFYLVLESPYFGEKKYRITDDSVYVIGIDDVYVCSGMRSDTVKKAIQSHPITPLNI